MLPNLEKKMVMNQNKISFFILWAGCVSVNVRNKERDWSSISVKVDTVVENGHIMIYSIQWEP